MRAEEKLPFLRDCLAITIPEGGQVILPVGAEVYLTQAMGGSFTVYYAGRLFRVHGEDADALGKEVPPRPKLPENADDEAIEHCVWDQLKTCYDPEIPINIVDLGLVYECLLEAVNDDKKRVYVRMTLTAPGCGMGDVLAEDVRYKVGQIPRIDQVDVDIVFDPPWSREMMSESARLESGLW